MPSHGRTVVAVVLLLSMFAVSPAGSAVADDLGVSGPVDLVNAQEAGEEAGEEGEEEEGGIEGAIEGFIEAQGTVGAVIVLLGGILLLTACTEKLISYLARASINMKMSLFALAIIFTGFEFDDTILALVLSGGGLEGAALGTALGTGLAIIGVTLALAAIIRPFPAEPGLRGFCQKEPDHLRRGVRTLAVGIGSGLAATGPGMTRILNDPQLDQRGTVGA